MKGMGPALPLTINFVDGPYGMIKNYRKMISQNFKNLVLTSPGERIMNPDFGVGIRNILFELDIVESRTWLKRRILSQASEYMPMIEIEKIDFSPDKDSNEIVYLNIFYRVPSLNLSDSLILDISPANRYNEILVI